MDRFSIGIDGFNLALRRGTGVATYGFALARTLQQAGHRIDGVFGIDTGQTPALREVMFFDLLSREEPKNKTRAQVRRENRRLLSDAIRPRLRLEAAEVPLTDRVEKSGFENRLPTFDRIVSARRLFEVAFRHFDIYRRFTQIRMTNPPQVMHWTYPVPVMLEGAKNIYTLHDLVPLRLPYTTLDSKRSYAEIAQQCAERADHICTVSEASRADIIAQFNISANRVTNTYQSSPLPPSATASSANQDAHMIEGIFGLPPKGYFLFFGAIEPKKNLGRLIEAYLSIQTETPLVIVGSSGWQSDDELRLLSGSNSRGVQRIIRLEFLPRDLLLRLIRSARAVAFPSLYEGFGLPVLEAMQLGTPVLTSVTSSLPEVAGDGAILVNPYDVTAIATGLRTLDLDAALRERLAQNALAHVTMFSEANYLARLEAMYARLLGSGAL